MNNIIDFEKRLLDAAKMIKSNCLLSDCCACPFYRKGNGCAFETTPNLWKLERKTNESK